MVEVLPASCRVRSRRFQLQVERFEVKSSLRDGSPNHHALRHVKHSKACEWPIRCRAKQSGSSLSPWHAPPFGSPSLCIRWRPSGDYRTNGARPEQAAKALLRQVHLGSSASAQSWLPRAGLSCTLWSSMKDAALLPLVGSIAQCQRSAAGLLVPNRGSNPSVEGTSTSKLRLLAAAPHVKR